MAKPVIALYPISVKNKAGSSLVYLLCVLSGCAGLGYQMVWTRLLAVALGHEIAAVLAVVAAFFVGLALGGWFINKTILRADHPALWYSLFEGTIAIWSVLLIFIIPLFNQAVPALIGQAPTVFWQWFVSFFSSLLLLFPATLAMGATLPALERLLSGSSEIGRSVAVLYALNTLGAVLGTLFTTFVLIRYLGLSATLLILAALNGVCSLGILVLERTKLALPVYKKNGGYLKYKRLLALLFFSGLLGIGLEVLLVRLLSQILENTVYTYASILSVYLLATVLGAAGYRRYQRFFSAVAWHKALQFLLATVVAGVFFSVFALQVCAGAYQYLWKNLGQNLFAAVLGELAIATMVFGMPAAFMGALFCHLASRAARAFGLGAALAINTLGAALAPLLFGVFLLPFLGAKWAVYCVLCGYVLLLIFPWRKPNTFSMGVITACVLGLAGFVVLPLQYQFIKLTPGSEVVEYREGVMAAVAVVQDSAGHKHLKVNNHFTMGGTATRFSDHRQTHLPMLLHGQAHSVLYLGLGSGVTFEAAKYYRAETVVGVELLPEVLPMLSQFSESSNAADWSHPPRILAADARRFVLANSENYDVIIGEIFHPSRDGAGALYTHEHFEAVKNRLQRNGLFCQWLPLFQLDLENLKTVIRTFSSVFPYTQLYLGHLSLTQPILCLAGRKTPWQPQEHWLMEKVSDTSLQQALIKTRLNSDYALFGSLIAEGKALKNFAGGGPVNSDNFPRVTYHAPGFVYGAPEPAATRLLQLLTALPAQANPLGTAEPAFTARINHYREARDEFIRIGVLNPPDSNLQQWAGVVVPKLLKLVAHSKDFEPAYRTLMAVAQRLHETDPNKSIAILQALDATVPEFPEARQMAMRLLVR